MTTPSGWWYGVVAFPVVVLTALLARFGTRRFVAVSMAESGDLAVAAGVASFLLTVLAQWVGVLVALVVLVCLALDVRALRAGGAWAPSRAWGVAGVAHLVGALFAPALLVSVPSLSYYLYRRRERVGAP